MFKITSIAAGLLGLSVVSGFAADLPVREPAPAPVMAAPIFTWTGFYAGLNAGYHWSHADLRVTHLPTQAAFNADPYSVGLNPSGFIGGGQVGYNWQTGSFVLGVEVDAQYMSGRSSRTFGPLALFGGAPQLGSFGIARSETNMLATARGRIGVAFNQSLLYLTGGLAFGNVKDFSRAQYGGGVGNTFNYIGATDGWRTGYALGAGWEYAVSGNWSVKAEYLYYDLGRHSVTGLPVAPNAPFATVNRWRNDGHIARVGLNYRFGGPAGGVVARY